jgi:protoporphyrinogen/coproporphyrinogen III oxidase
MAVKENQPMMQPLNIAVLGGGISGLSTSYFIAKAFPSARITLFEKLREAGGAVKTESQDGYQFELGPKSIRNSHTLHALVDILEETKLNKLSNKQNIYFFRLNFIIL